MNKFRGDLKIELADGEYTLRYTTNAVCQIEEVTDKGLYEAAMSTRIGDIRATLWGGLLYENPRIMLEDVGSLMDGVSLVYIREKVTEAISLGVNIGIAEEDEQPGESEPPPYKPKEATG